MFDEMIGAADGPGTNASAQAIGGALDALEDALGAGIADALAPTVGAGLSALADALDHLGLIDSATIQFTEGANHAASGEYRKRADSADN